MIKINHIFILLFVSLSINSHGSVRNGVAIHQSLGKEIFIAALYSQQPSKNSSGLLCDTNHCVMELRVIAEKLSKRRLHDMWRQNVSINSSKAELSKYGDSLINFNQMIKDDLHKGDAFIIESRDNVKFP